MPVHLEADFQAGLQKVLQTRSSHDHDIARKAEAIIADVQARGDAAVQEYTQRFDGHARKNFHLTKAEIAASARECPPEVRTALDFAAKRIRSFHEKAKPQDWEYTDTTGVRMGYRYTPISAAGIYAPGGLAAYPSSVLMNAIPAQVAGVSRLMLCCPAPQEVLNPAVMAAVELLELDEVTILGGAQAIAAMAYGTESIDAVDFIAGPGNAYVAAAKRSVFGQVGIDSLAGPSEVTVVADSGARPNHVAWDLLAQAEHDPLAQSILISDSQELITAVSQEIDTILQTLPRGDIATASWRDFGATVLVQNIADAAILVDQIAPEHLILSVAEPESLCAEIQHAGSIFLGYYTPEAIGDYLSGPNHVLPTSGSARYASGLSTESFMKRSSFQQMNRATLQKIAEPAMALAKAEGLDAHRMSLQVRLDD